MYRIRLGCTALAQMNILQDQARRMMYIGEKKLRMNGYEWIEIPESPHIGPEIPEAYHYFRYPVIPIPLEQLHEGQNTFELTCGNQIVYKIGDGWGQWGIHGAILRIYYASEKPHLRGTITSPAPIPGVLKKEQSYGQTEFYENSYWRNRE